MLGQRLGERPRQRRCQHRKPRAIVANTLELCRRAQMDYATPQCQAFSAPYLDRTIGELFLEAVQPAALETTFAALAVLERERERRALDRQ